MGNSLLVLDVLVLEGLLAVSKRVGIHVGEFGRFETRVRMRRLETVYFVGVSLVVIVGFLVEDATLVWSGKTCSCAEASGEVAYDVTSSSLEAASMPATPCDPNSAQPTASLLKYSSR